MYIAHIYILSLRLLCVCVCVCVPKSFYISCVHMNSMFLTLLFLYRHRFCFVAMSHARVFLAGHCGVFFARTVFYNKVIA